MHNPCRITSILVPCAVLCICVKHKKNLLPTIPLSITTILYHQKLVEGIRKYDIMVAFLTYITYTYSHIKRNRTPSVIIFPVILYAIGKVFEQCRLYKASNYAHAFSHISVIPMVLHS